MAGKFPWWPAKKLEKNEKIEDNRSIQSGNVW